MVTGKLGSGKSLSMVDKIKSYLEQKRMVATNLDLHLEKLISPWNTDSRVMRLPDKPVVDDLEALPSPYTGKYDENKTGILVLDECGTWFNTRKFNDKTRQPLIDKLLHIRKAGWDVYFIVQHIDMIDKQVREGLGEHIVYCQRMDRLAIPLITGMAKFMGFKIRPPKIHLANVKYGSGQYAPIVDRWFYNGSQYYNAYDTRQVFGANDCAIHSVLPPYTVYGRYITQKQLARRKYVKTIATIRRIYKRQKYAFLFMGVGLGFTVSTLVGQSTNAQQQAATTETKEEKQVEKSEPASKKVTLKGIRITATIQQNGKYEYIFWNDLRSERYYPQYDDYVVRAVDDCAAKLMTLNESFLVTCYTGVASDSGSTPRGLADEQL